MAAPHEGSPWALVYQGKVIASRKADQTVPWWSFTKTILAASALRLVAKGLLTLDEPVSSKGYTLRHLLQHRAGLPDYGGLSAYHEAVERQDLPWTFAEIADRCDAERLRYEPGHGWAYSNIGYALVARLIKETSRTRLDSALRGLVFDPLTIESARVAENAADLQGVQMGQADWYHPGWVYHGLVVGTVADAALLLDRLLSTQFLSVELLEELRSAHFLPGPVPGRSWLKPGYGLGVMAGETTKGEVIGHTGGGPGSSIAVYRSLANTGLTAALVRFGDDAGPTEEEAFGLIGV
ncbi:serine hydrolase domain-containing protein [Microvirga puerhi]|uniref:Beta-lactamase family protein n=1 Tax=Microvirga puerhi TaxID=2876078 RepID=A0ABS7VIU6_9HYPH|nr:beta-lactamase family protein [Microvirga puerhi]